MAPRSTTSSLPAFRFRDVVVCPRPYPHFEAADFLDPETADSLLAWLAQKAPWQPQKLDGYDGYADISLGLGDLPPRLNFLLAPESLSYLRLSMGRFFEMGPEGHVRVTAHRLLPGSSLRPHCDVSPVHFTHRLLVQLNQGWTRQNGGLLCVFDGDPSTKKPTNQKLILPAHRSAFAFEISRRSFHAVTPVVAGERYTLSYTFYPPSAKQA
jgi:hypothetical protein